MTDTFIRAVAAEVKGHGKKYETTLKERERNNPKYSFMLRKDVRLLITSRMSKYLILFQHRRHAFYKGLIESERDLEPEFDDEVHFQSVFFFTETHIHHRVITRSTRQTRQKNLSVNVFQKHV